MPDGELLPPPAGGPAAPHSLPVLFPARPMISSRPLGWANVVVERFQFSGAEYAPRAFAVHAIVMHLGRTVRMGQRRNGQVHTGPFPTHQLAIIPADQPSACWHTEPADALFISVDPLFLKLTAEQLGLDSSRLEIVSNLGTRDRQLEHIGQSLLHEVATPGLGGHLYAESLTTQLAVHLLRHHSAAQHRLPDSDRRKGKGLPPAALERAMAFINDQLHQDLALADIAAAVHLSPYYFSRLFKQSLGIPPHQYVITRRVEAAKRLLAQGTLTTAEVAAEVGFADYSHMARIFRRLVGVRPAEFARAHRPARNGEGKNLPEDRTIVHAAEA